MPSTLSLSQDTSDDLAIAHAYCKRHTRRTAKNFYYAFLFLPEEDQKAAFAIYAYCREADDLADAEGMAIDDRLAALDAYETHLDECLRGENVAHPVFVALGDVLKQSRIPAEGFRLIIEGMRQDLSVHRYRTFEDLADYCYKVASAVALLLTPLFDAGRGPEIEPYVKAGGLAVQLTNILRDVAEDARMGRIYLPLEDLERFDLSEDDILKGVDDQRFKALMAFEADRARGYYEESEALLTPRDRKRQQALETARHIYWKLLDRIVARDYDVYSDRVSLSSLEKLGVALSCFLRGLVSR